MGSARSKKSWTTRTVQGPRRHSTRRISSSALVGRGGVGRGVDRLAMIGTRLVADDIRRYSYPSRYYPGGAGPGSRRATRTVPAVVGNGARRGVAPRRQRAAGFLRWVYPRYSSPYILISSKQDHKAGGPINKPRLTK